jgi:hypothetical protein
MIVEISMTLLFLFLLPIFRKLSKITASTTQNSDERFNDGLPVNSPDHFAKG